MVLSIILGFPNDVIKCVYTIKIENVKKDLECHQR